MFLFVFFTRPTAANHHWALEMFATVLLKHFQFNVKLSQLRRKILWVTQLYLITVVILHKTMFPASFCFKTIENQCKHNFKQNKDKG